MFLQGTFYYKGKKHRLTLKDEGLTLEPEGLPDLQHTVLGSEIVSCWVCPRGNVACAPGMADDPKECPHWKTGNGGLSVEVSCRKEGRRWEANILVFFHVAKEVLLTWRDAIWSLINGLGGRPRRLLVLINPIGGRRKGVSNFKKKVSPLFQRAAIRTHEILTEYKGHGTRLVQETASEGLLKECDGIVAVGGDGLVSEMVTGLFILASSEQGVDPHDFQADLPVTQVRLGIIPSGSTDATCFATHGSSDVVTAALHIIMGDNRSVDVATLHSGNKLQRVVTSLISYGYFGDLLRSSEQWRCLGPPRYFLSGIQQMLRNRSYPVQLKVRKNKEGTSSLGDHNISSSSIRSTLSCSSICNTCSQAQAPRTTGPSEEDWEEITGKYAVVSAAVTSCACRLTPQGVSPSGHLGDGFSDLILVDGSSRAKLLSYLYHTSVTGNAANLSHVQVVRTNEIHFSASPNISSLFNCDGEEFESSSVRIKIQRQKLKLFCRGIEDIAPSSSTKFKTSTSF